jgi:hypothetical protein
MPHLGKVYFLPLCITSLSFSILDPSGNATFRWCAVEMSKGKIFMETYRKKRYGKGKMPKNKY